MGFTEKARAQKNYGERSPSQRRRLVIASASARQLVKSKGALQFVHAIASERMNERSGRFVLLILGNCSANHHFESPTARNLSNLYKSYKFYFEEYCKIWADL